MEPITLQQTQAQPAVVVAVQAPSSGGGGGSLQQKLTTRLRGFPGVVQY